MSNQWKPPLDKCCNCQKSFNKGQEYWNLQKEGITTMNFCDLCQKKHTLEKKSWQNTSQTKNECNKAARKKSQLMSWFKNLKVEDEKSKYRRVKII